MCLMGEEQILLLRVDLRVMTMKGYPTPTRIGA